MIASAARDLEHEVGSQSTLDKVVELAVMLTDNADHAAISLVQRGKISTPAASSNKALRVDELQYEHQQGPCVEAILVQEVVHSADIANDERWPDWGPRTTDETGIRSMLSTRMFTITDTIGALNMYSGRPDAFDADDTEVGQALAAQAAVAVVAAQQIEALHVAVDSRTVIGQAVGILMERFSVDAPTGFAVLKRVSQSSNRKLHAIAQELVTTGRTPQ